MNHNPQIDKALWMQTLTEAEQRLGELRAFKKQAQEELKACDKWSKWKLLDKIAEYKTLILHQEKKIENIKILMEGE